MPVRRLPVPSGGEGRPARLDSILAALIPEQSRTRIQQWIRDGLVEVDGTIATSPSVRPRPGAELAIHEPGPAQQNPGPSAIEFRVVFSDEHLLMIDKPAGVAVHPGPGHSDDTLVNGLLRLHPNIAGVGDPERPGIVHRLDRDTSGLLVVAASSQAFDLLSTMIREHQITRRYTALVLGQVEPKEAHIDAPIGRDLRDPMRMSVRADGRDSRTHYALIEQFQRSALLGITLETGRTHQIRVHLASVGFAVAGDRVYGAQAFALSRQFLHASELEFAHPVEGTPMRFESPLPPDLQDALALARSEQPPG